MKKIYLIGIVSVVVMISGGAYYLGSRGLKVNFSFTNTLKPTINSGSNIDSNTNQNSNSSTTLTQDNNQTPLFTGQIERLKQDLKLFVVSEADIANGVDQSFIYYKAGTFARGELKDFDRIVAVRQSGGPGEPLVYVLATKDYQKYYFNDPKGETTKYPETDWGNPYMFINKSKIISTKIFDSNHPDVINLDKTFSLYLEKYPTDNVFSGKLDKNGNQIYETPLVLDYSSYKSLNSPISSLKFYYKPYSNSSYNSSNLSQKDKDRLILESKYFLGMTEVIAVDSTGFPALYSMTTVGNVQTYQQKMTQYQIDLEKYQAQLKLYNDKKTSKYPDYPQFVSLPSMGFKGSDISAAGSTVFFNTYETAIPGACAFSLNSRIMNVSDGDLTMIGKVSNTSVYSLKDKANSLYTMAFNNKMDPYLFAGYANFSDVNKGVKQPTISEYISKNPLLFMKDYWGRWVGFGEYDILLPGGCGKPVVYLYPETATEISVKFNVPVRFTTEIPVYKDFWKVLAYPNGLLVNLKPELTDCTKIDKSHFGSEYAKKACEKNEYPYLYWAGNVESKNYPQLTEGWVVQKNELRNFFDKKLTEIGFNTKEKADFISYWVSELEGKNSPYYRISFFQTSELNELFPMTVAPEPTTTFRLFLDYSLLTEKPKELPVSQTLNKLVRNGFTLVEWGGLKK